MGRARFGGFVLRGCGGLGSARAVWGCVFSLVAEECSQLRHHRQSVEAAVVEQR